jgi:hypothetical protein
LRVLSPLFDAVGLPVEGIGILIAVDALPDLFATTLNVYRRCCGGGRGCRDRTAALASLSPPIEHLRTE